VERPRDRRSGGREARGLAIACTVEGMSVCLDGLILIAVDGVPLRHLEREWS
jgi:hypothetical protein